MKYLYPVVCLMRMKFSLSEKAMKKIVAKGGEVAIDFIRPVGCGKVSEVSITTNLKGRNIANYDKVIHENIQIYFAKELERYTESLDLVLHGGLLGSKLAIRQSESLAFPSDCKLP